jgi:hypothetical protein
MPIQEITTRYKDRPAGSVSKLRTYRDGMRILLTILILVKEERPLQFFSLVGVLLMALSVTLAMPVLTTFLATGLVPRLPTAVLATGLMLLSFLSFACGLILDSVSRGRKEFKRISYLTIPALQPDMRARTNNVIEPVSSLARHSA